MQCRSLSVVNDVSYVVSMILFFFFFNDTATTEIYTLSLHDALPIYHRRRPPTRHCRAGRRRPAGDRKSTRLNSSHLVISCAVFCLKKKKEKNQDKASKKLTYTDRATTRSSENT